MLVLKNTRKQNTLYLDKNVTIDHHDGMFSTVEYDSISFIEYWNNQLSIRLKKNFKEITLKGISHSVYIEFTNYVKAKLGIREPSLDTL